MNVFGDVPAPAAHPAVRVALTAINNRAEKARLSFQACVGDTAIVGTEDGPGTPSNQGTLSRERPEPSSLCKRKGRDAKQGDERRLRTRPRLLPLARAPFVQLLETYDVIETITHIIGVASAFILEQGSADLARLMRHARQQAPAVQLLAEVDFRLELMLATRYAAVCEIDASRMREHYSSSTLFQQLPTIVQRGDLNIPKKCPRLRRLNLQVRDLVCRQRIFSADGCEENVHSLRPEQGVSITQQWVSSAGCEILEAMHPLDPKQSVNTFRQWQAANPQLTIAMNIIQVG